METARLFDPKQVIIVRVPGKAKLLPRAIPGHRRHFIQAFSVGSMKRARVTVAVRANATTGRESAAASAPSHNRFA
jgi:hypothetical protein